MTYNVNEECEFICILLSPELLSINEWFYQNYIEPVTENSLFLYLYLGKKGWKGSILEKFDRLYTSFTAQKTGIAIFCSAGRVPVNHEIIIR